MLSEKSISHFLMRLKGFGISDDYPNLIKFLNKHNKESFSKINHYKNTLKALEGESYFRIVSFIKLDKYLIDSHINVNDNFVMSLEDDNYEKTMDKLKDDFYLILDVVDKSLFKEGSTIILIQYNNCICLYDDYEMVVTYNLYNKY